jgi:5-aminolevulinate synthase
MGPALTLKSNQIVAGYASVAGHIEHHNMDPEKTIDQCPHASAARAAARVAEDLAAAAKKKEKSFKSKGLKDPSPEKPGLCPFHHVAAESPTKSAERAKDTPVTTTTHNSFDYEQFYIKELDKKHTDKSYRYFNNINRLAAKFPVAHTSDVNDEVEVWCANDYLGMGNNPVVLETMQ